MHNKRKQRLAAVMLSAILLLTACSTGQQEQSPTPTTEPSGTQAESTASGTSSGDADSTTHAYAAEMDKDSIMSIEINVDPDEWQTMLDNATDEEYISADITINGTTVENVGIRPKGNSSLSSVARDEESDRYSFKIKFDKFVDGQTWLGLDDLVINSNYADTTSMKEYLSYDIMNYIGVDTPMYAYADISVNGESWGFYLAIEDYEGSYKERAKNDEGELYKPESMEMGGGMMNRENMPEGFDPENIPDGMGAANGEMPEGFDPSQIPDALGGANAGGEQPEGFDPGNMPEGMEMPGGANGERPEGGGFGGMGSDNGVALKYTDDEESSYSSIFDNAKTKTDADDHKRVIEAIKGLNEATDLESYVDVDATLRYLAAHTVVVNMDSYSSTFGHNYILYENDGKISMLPWDYNMAFGGFQSGDASDVVNFPIDTPVSGVSMEDRPMISKLLEVPEYMEKYHQYLQEIIDGYFADGAFEEKVDSIDAMIGEHIQNDPSAFYTYKEYQSAIAELKKLGTLRSESIQGQLDGSIPSTTDGQKAEPDSLVDASAVDMSTLGDMGGMGGFGGGGRRNWGNNNNDDNNTNAAPETTTDEEQSE